jgi:hypothetical protein
MFPKQRCCVCYYILKFANAVGEDLVSVENTCKLRSKKAASRPFQPLSGPRLDGLPVRVFWFSEPAVSADVQVINIDQVPIRIYSPEKTIADCFKYRN